MFPSKQPQLISPTLLDGLAVGVPHTLLSTPMHIDAYLITQVAPPVLLTYSF